MCHTGGLLRRASMVVQLEAKGLEPRFWTISQALDRLFANDNVLYRSEFGLVKMTAVWTSTKLCFVQWAGD
jgi:hypothetical protein